MFKILFVHNSLDFGGAQSVRYMFLKHLDSKLLSINICCLANKGEFGKKIEALGYKIDAFNLPYGLLQLSTTLKLYHYIKGNNFDIVHSALFHANYHAALAARWAKVPFLITEEHGEHYFHSKKRHFIDALIELNKGNLFLIIIGDGPIKNNLKEYAQKLGVTDKVRFTGWRNDVADMLNALDIFVLPSVSEGLPISLLEAMSIGLPCIASRVGGIKEVIEDGITGLLVSPRDLGDLTIALKQVINNRNFGLELGLAARRYAMDNFKPSIYVDQVIGLYKRLLK